MLRGSYIILEVETVGKVYEEPLETYRKGAYDSAGLEGVVLTHIAFSIVIKVLLLSNDSSALTIRCGIKMCKATDKACIRSLIGR